MLSVITFISEKKAENLTTRTLQRRELSRSKLELFRECPRCFHDDTARGVKRPSGPAFTLNIAVDELLKKEFDVLRAARQPHPLFAGVPALADVLPFVHPSLDEWRYNFKGVRWQDPATGWTLFGAVDDVWTTPAGELLVVDYKATAKAADLTEASLYDGYRRQAEVYQFLLRGNGFKVAEEAWFVYANGDKTRAAFDAELKFRMTLIPYRGNDAWVLPTFHAAVACATAADRPAAAAGCEWCAYADGKR